MKPDFLGSCVLQSDSLVVSYSAKSFEVLPTFIIFLFYAESFMYNKV